jgi:hypothetical protein
MYLGLPHVYESTSSVAEQPGSRRFVGATRLFIIIAISKNKHVVRWFIK